MDSWHSHWCVDDDDDDEDSLFSVDWWQNFFDMGPITMMARNYVLYKMAYPAALEKKVDHEFYPRNSMLLLL